MAYNYKGLRNIRENESPYVYKGHQKRRPKNYGEEVRTILKRGLNENKGGLKMAYNYRGEKERERPERHRGSK